MKQHEFFKYRTTILLLVVSMYFIQAYAFDTNLNLALSKPATVRDTWTGDGGIYTASKAVDGNLSTSWMAAVDGGGTGSWLYVDLQNYYMINKVIIAWSNSRWPRGAWKLQVATAEPDASGNSNWVDVYTGNAGSDVVSGTGTYIFTATAGRFVRMLGTTQSTSYGYHILEMSVFGNDNATPQGVATSIAISPLSKTLMVSQSYQFQSTIFAENGIPMNVSYSPTWSVSPTSGASIDANSGLFTPTQTGTYTISCNTTYNSTSFNASATVTAIPFDATQNLALNKTATTSGQTASNGNDGNLNSRWRSNNNNQQEWWQVDLGADYVVNNVTIKMNTDAGARNATYNILVSLTGLSGSWQTVVSSAQIPAGSSTEFNSHTIASTPARYVKYDGLTKGGWDHNFAEFEVRGIGYYHAPAAAAVFTSILFSNANVIANEEVALTIAAMDADNSPYLDATITGLEVTAGNAAGLVLEKRSNVWYARGVSQGTYTLTATGVDNVNGSIIKTGTATLTVTEARRVVSIALGTTYAVTKYAANRSIGLTLSCTDQYGSAINPTIVWDIQGAAGGSVTTNRYTPANKGTATIKATSTTTAGIVQSSSITFDVITDGENVALNKPVTSISTATGSTNAVDGNEGSQWIVPDPGSRVYDGWLVIDLQASYLIELVEVIWEGAYSKTYTVDYSDNGVDFTTKYTGTNTDPIVTKVNKFYSSPSKARYVRIHSTEAGTIYGVKILEVYINAKNANVTNYFRTTGSGSWSDLSTWETSSDNINWTTADVLPSSYANTIDIASGQTVTLAGNTTASTLNINPRAKLTLTDGKTLTVNALNLSSDASGSATFVDNNISNPQAITANVQQYLTTGRNWYVSSPVASANSSALNLGTSVVCYNEPTAAWVTQNSATLNPMKGYISASTTSTGTVTFSGTLNTGSQSITLSRTNGVAKTGFNLVGNPYPSYVNWNMATKTNLETTIWYRTKTVEASPVYTFDTYNATGSVGTNNNLSGAVTQYIPPMQAFWVRVAAGQTSGTLAFDNSMRTHESGTNRLKALGVSKSEQQVVRLQVSNNVNSDEAIILFNPNASDGFDDYDSPKMTNANPAIPEIYTVADNNQLVINGLNAQSVNKELPLGFYTGATNTFSIKASEVTNFDANMRIILKDKLMNTEFDITDGSAYNFSSDIANTASRFSIIFKATSVTTEVYNTFNQSVNVYLDRNNHIEVNYNGANSPNANVTICNAIGQVLLSIPFNEKNNVINKSFVAGVYFVTVSADGKSVTKKLIFN